VVHPLSSSTRLLTISARVARHGLIGAECRSLTGGMPDTTGVATAIPAKGVEGVERAAFVQQGLAVIATGQSFDELVDAVKVAEFHADRFRIDVHDPADRSTKGTTEAAIALADVIPFGPDLRAPAHRFVVIPAESEWIFAEVITTTDAGYRRHDDKPWTTSSSLDSRFARGLVNLVPDARSILDPCCGAGSIVLEAALLGLDARGVDWKPAMVGMTAENLAHFDYSASVVQADSRSSDFGVVDAVVTDLPYGHAIEADEDTIRAILANCARTAPLGVFVAPSDFSPWLTSAGYTDIEVVTVLKRRGFTRWIHQARSTLVP
jgi:tRNA (guanine10-N2)-dimethyltransferase